MILGAKNYAKHTTANHSVVVKLDAGGWETIAFNYKHELDSYIQNVLSRGNRPYKVLRPKFRGVNY